MAVTATTTRTHYNDSSRGPTEFGNMALSGTYATGGFTWNPRQMTTGLGQSNLNGLPIGVQFFSPLGYIYASSIATTGIVTTKILTAANTEFTNGSAVPEATVPFMVYKRHIS